MEISLDTKRYLDHIGSRIRAYHNVMNRAKEFVLDRNIYDHEIVLNCIIMSLLWLASVRGELLSEEDLLMFLNLQPELADSKTVELADAMKEWPLEEVLQYVVENF